MKNLQSHINLNRLPQIEDQSKTTTPRLKRKSSRFRRFFLGMFFIGAIVAAATQFNRVTQAFQASSTQKLTETKTESLTGRVVYPIRPQVNRDPVDILLPAQLSPYEQTSLLARLDGYVSKWHVDRGAKVKAGDLLAEIDAPELDQQTRQAEAALEQGRATLIQLTADLDQAKADWENAKSQVKLAEANKSYAEREYQRTNQLVVTRAVGVSEHESNIRNRDVTTAQVNAARSETIAKEKTIASRQAAIGTQAATIRGLEASLNRLKELQKFKKIIAPFEGSIIRRYAEVGMLVQANNNQPLFQIQNSSTLRIQVDVPQVYAQQARQSKTGELIVPEKPNHPYIATVARSANALDPVTRTLRLELEMPNPDRIVYAGTYAQIRMRIPKATPTILLPISTLRYTPQGIEVAMIQDGEAKIQSVQLGRDYGKTIEVIRGLDGSEELVNNPTDDLRTGDKVQIASKRE